MTLRPVILLVALALALVGCGTASNEGTQPRPDVTSFEQGGFDDIPLLPTSEPISPPNEQQGTVSRSYVVGNTSPDAVMSFYQQQLAERPVVEPPAGIGVNTFRGRWQLDQDRILTVSATSANNLQGPEDFGNAVETITQYSLSLAPPGS